MNATFRQKANELVNIMGMTAPGDEPKERTVVVKEAIEFTKGAIELAPTDEVRTELQGILEELKDMRLTLQLNQLDLKKLVW